MKTELYPATGLTDSGLVVLMQQNNHHAFAQLVKRHNAHLKKYIHAILHNSDDEKDALQDVWTEVLDKLRKNKYTENGLFHQWLNTITYRVALKYLKPKEYDFEDISAAGSLADEMTDPDMNKNLVREVRKEIRKMNKVMQCIFYMRVIKEMSFDEIASQLHTSVGVATKLFSRAKERLQKHFHVRAHKKNILVKVSQKGGGTVYYNRSM